jgi:hypothetical protein
MLMYHSSLKCRHVPARLFIRPVLRELTRKHLRELLETPRSRKIIPVEEKGFVDFTLSQLTRVKSSAVRNPQ